jgi:predicted lipoprotein with Yx(FWY)xxD motif
MRSSTLFSMGLLALSVSLGVAGCGDDDDDDNTGAAGKGGGGSSSTAGKGGASGSSSTAGKGGSNSTAGKGGTNGASGEDGGGGEPATAGGGPVGGESAGGNGAGGAAAGADSGGQTGEGGGAGQTAEADVGVNGADVMTDGEGFSLYIRDTDTAGDTPVSSCSGGCLATWPVFYVDAPNVPAELDASDFDSFERADAAMQSTYKGWPLYRFAADTQPGQTNGAAIDTWHVVKIPFVAP